MTATSTIRAAGGAILVDFRPVAGPYEVSAIGPEEMTDRFRDSAAARLLRTLAADHGMSFEVRDAEGLVLPAGSGPQLRYAEPSPSPTGVVAESARPNTPAPAGTGTSASPSPTGGG